MNRPDNRPSQSRFQSLGKLFAKHRTDAGKTQREIAARLGVDVSHVFRIEKGNRGTTEGKLRSFAAHLGLDSSQLNELLLAAGYPAPMYETYPAAEAMLALLRDSRDDERRYLSREIMEKQRELAADLESIRGAVQQAVIVPPQWAVHLNLEQLVALLEPALKEIEKSGIGEVKCVGWLDLHDIHPAVKVASNGLSVRATVWPSDRAERATSRSRREASREQRPYALLFPTFVGSPNCLATVLDVHTRTRRSVIGVSSSEIAKASASLEDFGYVMTSLQDNGETPIADKISTDARWDGGWRRVVGRFVVPSRFFRILVGKFSRPEQRNTLAQALSEFIESPKTAVAELKVTAPYETLFKELVDRIAKASRKSMGSERPERSDADASKAN